MDEVSITDKISPRIGLKAGTSQAITFWVAIRAALIRGGGVAEWSKALLFRDKKN